MQVEKSMGERLGYAFGLLTVNFDKKICIVQKIITFAQFLTYSFPEDKT